MNNSRFYWLPLTFTIAIWGAVLSDPVQSAISVKVRDHRTEPVTESTVYLAADAQVFYKIADDTTGAGCAGTASVSWKLTPLKLTEQPTRYQRLLEKSVNSVVTRVGKYQLGPGGVGCVIRESFNNLRVGTWRLEFMDPTWGTSCEFELTKSKGKFPINFKKFLQGCTVQ
jgi:hypothetical protein